MKIAIDQLETMRVRTQNALDAARNSLREVNLVVVSKENQVAFLEAQVASVVEAINVLNAALKETV